MVFTYIVALFDFLKKLLVVHHLFLQKLTDLSSQSSCRGRWGFAGEAIRYNWLGGKMAPAREIAYKAARAGAQPMLGQLAWGVQIQMSPSPLQGLPTIGNDGAQGKSCPCRLSFLLWVCPAPEVGQAEHTWAASAGGGWEASQVTGISLEHGCWGIKGSSRLIGGFMEWE